MTYGFGFWFSRIQNRSFLFAQLLRGFALGVLTIYLLNLDPHCSILVTLAFLVAFWLTILKLERNWFQWQTLQSLRKKPSDLLPDLD